MYNKQINGPILLTLTPALQNQEGIESANCKSFHITLKVQHILRYFNWHFHDECEFLFQERFNP